MRRKFAASFPMPARLLTSAVSHSSKSGLMMEAERSITEQRKAMTLTCLRISFIAFLTSPSLEMPRDRCRPTSLHG